MTYRTAAGHDPAPEGPEPKRVYALRVTDPKFIQETWIEQRLNGWVTAPVALATFFEGREWAERFSKTVDLEHKIVTFVEEV